MSDEPEAFDELLFVGGLPYRIVLVTHEGEEAQGQQGLPDVHVYQDGRPVATIGGRDVQMMLGWALRACVMDSRRG